MCGEPCVMDTRYHMWDGYALFIGWVYIQYMQNIHICDYVIHMFIYV